MAATVPTIGGGSVGVGRGVAVPGLLAGPPLGEVAGEVGQAGLGHEHRAGGHRPDPAGGGS